MMSSAIAMGRFRRALIVSSEIASAGLNWDDIETAPLFGDGAAAVVLEAAGDSSSAMLSRHAQTFSEGAELCQVRSGGTRIRAREQLEQIPRRRVLRDGGSQDLSARGPGVAAVPAIAARASARGRCGDPVLGAASGESQGAVASADCAGAAGRAQSCASSVERGNQIAASIPTTLHQAIAGRTHPARRSDRAHRNGRGLSLGGAVLGTDIDMSVLVTGASGFIGHHVARACCVRGEEVVATGRTASALQPSAGRRVLAW